MLRLDLAERTLELQQTNALLETERERSERLLVNMLPPEIAHRLKQGETNIADHAPEVSVMFADIVNFTELSAARSPEDVVEILNAIFNMFDDEVADLGLEKIKTIGDAYMVVSGLPSAREDHATALATLAVRMQLHLPRLQSELGLDHLGLRIGIHSGPVVAGVIGRSKYSYDLWGDTVNVASRMESHGAEGAIHVSQDFVDALRSPGHEWKIEQRGDIEVKGKGSLRTYWLLWK